MWNFTRRRRIRQKTLAQSRQRESWNRLAKRQRFAESLEQRILLTTVTSISPLPNSQTSSVSTDIVATFDQNINASTATPQNFVVHSSTGQRTMTVSTTGAVVTAVPTSEFLPGELVQVTASSRIRSATGDPVVPRVWQFQTSVIGGSGVLSDSGLPLPKSVGVDLGDLDGDGDLDAFVTTTTGSQLWLNAGGVFSDSGQGLDDHQGVSVQLGDLDGDADLDAFVVNWRAVNRVWMNNGGVFTDSGQSLGQPFDTNRDVSLGDVDGDGDLDAFVAGAADFEGPQLLLNNGAGHFADSGQSFGSYRNSSVQLGDLDGDGDLDAFVGRFGYGDLVLFNTGGVFIDSGQNLGNHSSTAVSLGDLDGDGDLDAFVGKSFLGSRVWFNDGGVFSDGEQSLGNQSNSGVSLGDLDGDGDLDAFVTNRFNAGSRMYENREGVFVDSEQSLPGGYGGGVVLGDLDGDGDFDVFATDYNRGDRIWLNQNLTPSVLLSVSNPTIAEAAGMATVTATLAAAHTDPVTVELRLSGTATATEDYTISGTQIVIPAGSISGLITVTAVQDSLDEADETVIVDVSAVTNAQEAGTQQVTTTILDDDEAVPVPDVTLTVSNTAIPEADGVATFTANLSIATTVPVTIDLGISGTASASDYTAPATQIVVAPGATSGSIAVTAVQDEVDEPDETVVVDITGVTGGTEAGVQQQTTTIADDDEPIMPNVTLTLDNAGIPEAAGVATFTVALSEVTTVPVTATLGFTGTASVTDYTASGTQVVIAPGDTSGTITVTAVQDEVDEPDETVIVDIASVVGGNEAGEQQQTTTITDDDIAPSFRVTSLETIASGFVAEFNNPMDASEVNLYDTQTLGLGAADVTLVGATVGSVSGSLVVDEASHTVTFIRTGDPLAADTYTATFRSADNGFKDTAGAILDGDGDGTGGDDYTTTFTVAPSAANAITVGIPDFVRGPGQEVNLPADTTLGIPLSISDGAGVRNVELHISYGPTLLELTSATVGADMPPGAIVELNYGINPGLVIVTFSSPTELPTGVSTLVNLQATVPATDPSVIYGKQQVLDIDSVVITDANSNSIPAIADDAVHLAAYFGDVSGNGRINASDAAQVARIAALLDTGFAATLLTDPRIVGDISGNGRTNAADASKVAQFSALIPVPEIPPIPAGIVIGGRAGADLGPGLPSPTTGSTQLIDRPVDSTRATGVDSGEPSTAPEIFYPAVDRAMAEWSDRSIEDREEELRLTLEDAVEELFAAL